MALLLLAAVNTGSLIGIALVAAYSASLIREICSDPSHLDRTD